MAMLYILHSQTQFAVRDCARISKAGRRAFSSFPPLRAQNRISLSQIGRLAATKTSQDIEKSDKPSHKSAPQNGHQESTRRNATDLVPQMPKPGSLQHPRRSEVPARLLPKAQITPDLRLSPKERLQIEYETRRPPKALSKPGKRADSQERSYKQTDTAQSSKSVF